MPNDAALDLGKQGSEEGAGFLDGGIEGGDRRHEASIVRRTKVAERCSREVQSSKLKGYGNWPEAR